VDAATLAYDRVERLAEAMPAGPERTDVFEEIQAARDALGVARAGAMAAARTGDDIELGDIDGVIAGLRRWAERFVSERPVPSPTRDSGERGSPRRP
jgi:hypothetical protein